MKKLKAFIAESVSAEEFYNRDWEGHVAEEIVRLLDGKASYRIVLNSKLLCRAIESASENAWIAREFEKRKRRPDVIFGAEASNDDHLLTFTGACIAWPILYTVLATQGMNPNAFKDAVNKMNSVASPQFVYRRWRGSEYVRYPSGGR